MTQILIKRDLLKHSCVIPGRGNIVWTPASPPRSQVRLCSNLLTYKVKVMMVLTLQTHLCSLGRSFTI